MSGFTNLRLPYLLLLDWLYSPCRTLISLDQFPGVSIHGTFLQPLTYIFKDNSEHSPAIILLVFLRNFFLFGIFLNTFFVVFSSCILSTCPNHRNVPFLISDNIWLSIQIHQILTGADSSYSIFFTGPNIFFNISLSLIAKVCTRRITHGKGVRGK